MAGGSYTRSPYPQDDADYTRPVTRRATRILEVVEADQVPRRSWSPSTVARPTRVLEIYDTPLQKHRPWLVPIIVCSIGVIAVLLVLISAGLYQNPNTRGEVINFQGGGAYSIQVGGSASAVSKWQKSNQPLPLQNPVIQSRGPYSVLGKPTLSVARINQIMAAYHSPAAGKGQTMYDLGVKYGIDPAVALAFFLHESTMGTAGEARITYSLGNIRCTQGFPCPDGYTHYPSWEVGFEQWYKLMRNLYIAQWGKTTFETIIPTYAPQADNNDEAAYIRSLKHSLDVWHSGGIVVY
ncbi:MAG TPA: glucosaminidase domain-containing protein [Ktedonobacteraceae bacterium]|nr:glucosaminidase domain-containing protein [Ktedonobacteraceae bacterium]